MANEPTRRGGADEEDTFHPRMGRRRKPDQQRAPTLRGQVARAIAKHSGRKKNPGRTLSKRGRIAVRAPHPLSRRCVIKARYVPMIGNGRKLAKAHLAYLERDGVERDGSPGRFYGAEESFDAEAFRKPMAGEPRQFRFIVSPEDGDFLNLTEFTRQFVKQVEKDLGRRLDWAAVNHHNTDNPHVHIVVRGRDRAGDEVRINGRYIAREMRWRAQEIATRELGPRPELEFSLGRNPEVERPRLTEVDRAIAELVREDRTFSVRDIPASPQGHTRLRIARLQALEVMQLAKNEAPGVWRLADGWMKTLQDLGEYQDVFDRLRPLVGDRGAAFQIVDERTTASPFEGRVIGKGLDDELSGRMFVAIETTAAQHFYVRLAPEVAETFRENDTVRVAFDAERWVKPADRILARFAQGNGGVYDPARHRSELERLPRSPSAAGEPTPEQRVTANVRRLERLERFQLVKHLPDGRWQIRTDLLAQLEDRERTHPQSRLRVERVDAARNRAPAPARALQISELTLIADAAAKQLRLAYVSDPPTFSGRLMECVVAPSGREYVQVIDYRRGQFTLIAKPLDWDHLQGRTVHLSRDREQKLVLRLDLGLSR